MPDPIVTNAVSVANRGKASLLLVVILAAVAGAGLMWVAFVSNFMSLQNQVKVAHRMDNRVGVTETIIDPVDLFITNRPNQCLKIEKAYLDAGQLDLYIRNNCHRDLGYAQWGWRAYGPNHTVIAHGYTNTGDFGPADALIETHMDSSSEIPNDNRIVSIEVYASENSTL